MLLLFLEKTSGWIVFIVFIVGILLILDLGLNIPLSVKYFVLLNFELFLSFLRSCVCGAH